MARTGKSSKTSRAYEADLSLQSPSQQMSLEELRKNAREHIARTFHQFLPQAVEHYKFLAEKADSQETQRKAIERVMNEFREPYLPSQDRERVQVNVISSIPLPELSVVGGQSRPVVEIGGVAMAEPAPKKILPEPTREESIRSGIGRGRTSPTPIQETATISLPSLPSRHQNPKGR